MIFLSGEVCPTRYALRRSALVSGLADGKNIMLTARDVMTEEVQTIHPQASVTEAIEKLLGQRISGLPVTDDQSRLVGVITEYALLAIVYDDRVVQDTVAQHMTADVLTVDVNDPINKVADLCITQRVRRVPVMEEGQLVGLIARRDVLKALYNANEPASV